MSFVTDLIVNFFKDLFTDFLNFAFGIISDLLISLNTLNQYFDYSKFLTASQLLAGSVLIVLVFYQGFKRLSGNLIFDGNSKSVSMIAIQTIISGALIYLLPFSITNILIPINNYLIALFGSIGYPIQTIDLNDTVWNFLNSAISGSILTPISLLLMLVVFFVSFIILGFVSGKRYIELIVALLISPLVAIQFVNNQSAIGVWFKEVIALVFTQSVQFVLLQFLMASLTINNFYVAIILFVGAISVMASGPKILRQFMYSSGVGSTVTGITGSAGKMVAMKYMLTK